MIKTSIFISLTISSIFGFSQKAEIRPEISDLANKIANKNTYEVAFLKDSPTDQITRFNLLKEKANEKELILLSDHENGVVRVYSMKALAEKESEYFIEQLESHLRDLEKVTYIQIGFEFVHSTISELSVCDLITGFHPSDEQIIQKMDSLLLYKNNNTKARLKMLANKNFEAKDYTQVRKLTKNRNIPAAAIALAKFQNEKDVKLISKQIRKKTKNKYPYTIHEAVDAILHFPHPDFKDDLIYLQKKGQYKEFYAAIQYGDTFASNYFDHFISTKPESYRRYAFNNELEKLNRIMQENPSPLYHQLHFNIWKNYNIINDSLLEELTLIDPQQCEEIGIPYLESIPTLNFDREVLRKLLSFLVEQDEMTLTGIVCEQIEYSEVFQFRYWAEIAEQLNPIFTQQLLLDRYKKEANGHIGIPIVKALLSYNDPKIDQQTLEAVRSNDTISDWAMEKIIEMLNNQGLEL